MLEAALCWILDVVAVSNVGTSVSMPSCYVGSRFMLNIWCCGCLECRYEEAGKIRQRVVCLFAWSLLESIDHDTACRITRQSDLWNPSQNLCGAIFKMPRAEATPGGGRLTQARASRCSTRDASYSYFVPIYSTVILIRKWAHCLSVIISSRL